MENNSLYHHGIKGQRWGVRRFQNKNGTLTKAGRKRYANEQAEKQAKIKADEKAKVKAAQQEKAKLTAEEAAKKKAAEEEAAKQKRAEDLANKKSEVLKSRSAETFYKNRKMFTYDETKAMRQLLQEDDLIKKMIVEEPGKVEKFLTKAGNFVTKVKGVVDPAVDIAKKANEFVKLFDDGSNAAKPNTSKPQTKPGNDKPGNDKPGNDKPGNDKPGNDKPGNGKTNEKKNSSINIDNDVDFSKYEDHYSPSTIKVDWIPPSVISSAASFVYGALGSGSNKSSSSGTKSDNKVSIDLDKLLEDMSSEPSGSVKNFFAENNISGLLPPPKKEDD